MLAGVCEGVAGRASECAGVSGRTSECAGFWGLAVAGLAGAGECRDSTRMFCVGLVVAGFAGVVAGFACVGGSATRMCCVEAAITFLLCQKNQ